MLPCRTAVFRVSAPLLGHRTSPSLDKPADEDVVSSASSSSGCSFGRVIRERAKLLESGAAIA